MYIYYNIIYIYVTYVYITFHFILFLIVKTPSVCFIRWFPSSQQLGDEALWGELRQPAGKVPAHRDVLQLLRAVFQWIGRDNLQESPILKLSNGKIDGFRLRFSLKPIYWVLSWWFWDFTGKKRPKNQQEYRNIIWKISIPVLPWKMIIEPILNGIYGFVAKKMVDSKCRIKRHWNDKLCWFGCGKWQ